MIKRVIRILPIIILCLVILARLHVSFIRYFDSDEFSHLHWGWLIAKGYIPYRDFFYYITPFYQWFLAPLFFLPADETVLILARIWQFLIYLGCAVLIFRISKAFTQNQELAIFSTIIFVTFPMTFDKTVDVRPDMVMIILYLLAVSLILTAKQWTFKRLLVLGCLTSLSVLLLPKIVFALPALIYLFFTHKPRPAVKNLGPVIAGLIIPGLLLLVYLLAFNLVGLAYKSIVTDSVAVNAGKTPFSPWKALSPWPLVYIDRGGDSFPWRVNTAIWITAFAGLLIWFFKKPVTGVFFILFFGAGIIFLFLFPAPYLQYFLPLSVFSSLLSAYFIKCTISFIQFLSGFLGIRISKYLSIWISAALYVGILIILSVSFYQQYLVRLNSGNANDEQIGVIRSVLAISRSDESFYDMVGSYVFRPDGYIICCHPYAEFVDRLSPAPPALRDSLIARQTKFIILDRTGLSLWQPKPDDLSFMKSHYIPSSYLKIYSLGQVFGCINGSCIQYNLDQQPVGPAVTNTLEIIVPESYRVITNPPGRSITLDNKSAGITPVELKTGWHNFSVDPGITAFTIQLAR